MARHLESAARALVVLGVVGGALVYLISIGILVHDMLSWWAEFAVRSLQTTTEAPPPGW